MVWREKMIVFGGFQDGVKSNALHGYDFETCIWRHLKIKTGRPPARCGHSATVFGDKMVVFGGINRHLKRLNDTWVLDLRQ